MTPESFLADVLLPLCQARRRRGLSWLALAPDPTVESYWEEPLSRTGGTAHVPLGEVDGAAMLAALGDWWAAEGEIWLVRTMPDLEAMRQALAADEEEPSAPRLSYSAYPLF